MGPIASLFARIGVKADTQAVERFDLSLKSVLNTAKVAAIGITAFSAGVAKIATDSFKTASALKQFEVETGASTTELQKWQAVAQQAGASAESVAAGVKSIVQNQQNIRLGKGNYSPFLMLGIDPMQDPFKVLQDFRAKAAGLAPAMQANMAKSMGLSTEMLRVLQLSSEEFDRMAGGAFYMSPGQINSIDKARESVASIQNAFGHLANQITAAIAPEITKLSKGFIDFVKNNRGFIDGVKTGVQWVMKLADGLGRMVMTISNAITKTMGLKGALLVLAGVFAIINAPVTLLAGGLLLLFLLIDDIIAYTEGRGSLLGDFFESAPELKKGFDDMLGFIGEFMELLGAAFSGDWDSYNQITDKWGAFGVLVKGTGETLKAFKNTLWGVFTGNWSDFNRQMTEWGKFGELIRSLGGGLSVIAATMQGIFTGDYANLEKSAAETYRNTMRMFGQSDERTRVVLGEATPEEIQAERADLMYSQLLIRGLTSPEAIMAERARLFGIPTPQSIINDSRQSQQSTTVNNTATINVQGATDPQATGGETVRAFRNFLETRPQQK
jgi:hypothetical protein